MLLAQFPDANNMPANGRAKRERIRRAQRLAREAESTQARDARLVGQFYVAASRVGRSSRLQILALDEETKKKRRFLSNVVYEEVLTR